MTQREKLKFVNATVTDDSSNDTTVVTMNSAGHIVKNSSGTSMTQRENLKFVNATVTDDSTNNTTVVTIEGSGHTVQDSSGTDMTQRTNLKFVNASVTDDSSNDATIITLKDIQYSSLPSPSADLVGLIVQYVGSTDANYTRGRFYECTTVTGGSTTYAWVPINTRDASLQNLVDLMDVAIDVQDLVDYDTIVWDSVSSKFVIGSIPEDVQYSSIPTASSDYLSKIIQYTGTTENGYTNGFFYKCVYENSEYSWVECQVQSGGSGTVETLGDVVGATAKKDGTTAILLWTDPEDVGNDIEWAGTKVVRKIGSAPVDDTDGTLVVNSTTKNNYSDDGYEDSNLVEGNVYYYRFFPYDSDGNVTIGSAEIVDMNSTIITIPTQSGSVTYDGTLKIPSFSPQTGYVKSGQTSGTNAGTYAMIASLSNRDYIWSDGTTEDKQISWTIGKYQRLTPAESTIAITNRDSSGKQMTFTDLYGRTIASVTSSNTSAVTATANGGSVTLFPGSTPGVSTITVTSTSSDNADVATCTFEAELSMALIYGFHIDGDESDPDNKVTYLEDAVGMTPAYMDFSEGEFNYGSWGNAFFMPRPCMLKLDGTVDYYLDPDDYTLKADGETPSDIADETYDGCAMMEWGRNGKKIWIKIVPDANDDTSANVYIANYQADSNYHDWSFHNCDGDSVDHFYTGIYPAVLSNSNTLLKSLSLNKVPLTVYGAGLNGLIDKVRALNPSNKVLWDNENYAVRVLITMLTVLILKSTNSNKIGKGIAVATSNFGSNCVVGQSNTRGLFYGTSGNGPVKVFGMEQYFGGIASVILGIIHPKADTNISVKMTYGQEDGSTKDDYYFDANSSSGYIDSGAQFNIGSSGYITKMKFTEHGFFPKVSGGSSSTYYCDGVGGIDTRYNMMCSFGTYLNSGEGQGMFCSQFWQGKRTDYGVASIVYHPLAPVEEEE